MGFFEIMVITYLFVFIFGVFAGGLAIGLDEQIYDFEEVLLSPKETLKCIFQWQMIPFIYFKDYINLFGKIILTILITFLFLPFNIMVFGIFVCIFIIWGLCFGFYKLFKKR